MMQKMLGNSRHISSCGELLLNQTFEFLLDVFWKLGFTQCLELLLKRNVSLFVRIILIFLCAGNLERRSVVILAIQFDLEHGAEEAFSQLSSNVPGTYVRRG